MAPTLSDQPNLKCLKIIALNVEWSRISLEVGFTVKLIVGLKKKCGNENCIKLCELYFYQTTILSG